MRKSFVFTVMLFITLFVSAECFAQQWTSEQKDVWAGVEKYWQVASTGDAQAFMDYFDDSYIGWNVQSAVPQNKAEVSKWIENDFKNNTNVLYTITPLAIWVKGDFAYVHYYYAELDKNKETGKPDPSQGNWTDILMKKNGKWVLIGDHGGRTSKE